MHTEMWSASRAWRKPSEYDMAAEEINDLNNSC
jgi:hypothetical protein